LLAHLFSILQHLHSTKADVVKKPRTDNQVLQALSLEAAGYAIASAARAKIPEVEAGLSDSLTSYLAIRLEALEEKVCETTMVVPTLS